MAAGGVEAFLPHVHLCRVATSYGPSMQRPLCQNQRILGCQDERGMEAGTGPLMTMRRRASASCRLPSSLATPFPARSLLMY